MTRGQAIRRRFQADGLCSICRRPNSEVGQRGPRLLHAYCRKLLDAGYSVSDIYNIQQCKDIEAEQAG